MKNVTKKSNYYSEKTIFVKISSRDRESLDFTRANLEKTLTDLGGELVARKSKHNPDTHESAIAMYFENEKQMSKATEILKARTLLRSDGCRIKLADSPVKKDKMSKKYFEQSAGSLADEYIEDTRWN